MRQSPWRKAHKARPLYLAFFCTLGITIAVSDARLAAAETRIVSLNGTWNFVIDRSGSLNAETLASAPDIRPASVPGSWQSQFEELRDYAGIAWYWRNVTLSMPGPDELALLRFAAVDYKADVYVNGRSAGSHEGGYLPFELDITNLLHPGENQVALRVLDPGLDPPEVEGIRYAEIPHGKQDWYVQTSGPWQEVELRFTPRMHIKTLRIRAAADGKFTIQPSVVNTSSGQPGVPTQMNIGIDDPEGKRVWQHSLGLVAGQENYSVTGSVANPVLWNLDHPSLYKLRVSLSAGDSMESSFGFRTFETRDGKFILNGKLLYIRGALDQAFYPQTLYGEPSLEELRAEMRLAKELGLNLLRCHIKVPSPRYLQAADETGLLIWYEVPNWDKLTAESKRRSADTLNGMVGRDWNHPLIVIVSIINESWGANLKEAADREWLKRAYQEAKQIVPGWLVDDNSACCDNFHLATDIADFHQYNAIPDYGADFDRFVADQARRPRWLFSPYGDAHPKGNEPIMLSEFGNWGLPRVPSQKPWWFGRRFKGMDITLPEGVERRFAEYQYPTLFAGLDLLVDATQRKEYEALKYEIGSIRMHPEIQGYVITEFTDINWECNGLLDFWRKPKFALESLRKIQQDDLTVVRAEERNYTAGGQGEAEVYFSHYSDQSLAGATLTWTLEGTSAAGGFNLPPLTTGSVVKAGYIRFTVPAVSAPSTHKLTARVSLGSRIISEDAVELFFYPKELPELPPPVSFEDPRGKLRRLVNEMHARNYQSPLGSVSFPVLIASAFNDKVRQTLQSGGRVILIANDRQSLAPGLEILPRAGSDLDGNWISSFLWVRKDHEPFKRFPFPTLPGFETQSVAPGAVIDGVPPQHFGDVLSGLFYGWINKNMGTMVQARYGKGKLLICTFSVGTTYGNDPYATRLVDALVRYAVSDFTPEYEIPIAGR